MTRLPVCFVLLAACEPVVADEIPPPPPENCDGDGDGFIHPHPSCDAMRAGAPADCDDTNPDVHPGAAPVCGDGVVNSCGEPTGALLELGVEELGLIDDRAVFRTDQGGFLNDVDVAIEPGAPATALVVANDSARDVRVLRVRLEGGSTADPIPVTLEAGFQFANNAVNIARLGPSSYRLATLARRITGSNLNLATMRDFTPTTSSIELQPIERSSACPQTSAGDAPLVIHGIDAQGTMYFEDTPQPGQMFVFAAGTTNGPAATTCKDLSAVGAVDEFGSQLVASGTMAAGRASVGLWTWQGPLNYDDFHTYATGQPIVGAMAIHEDLLAQSNDPVAVAYQSSNGIVVEGFDCTGLAPCKRVVSTDLPFDAGAIRFARVGTGAAMVVVETIAGKQHYTLRLLSRDGRVLTPEPVATVAEVDGNTFARLGMSSAQPSLDNDAFEIVTAYVTQLPSTQEELRIAHARACIAR